MHKKIGGIFTSCLPTVCSLKQSLIGWLKKGWRGREGWFEGKEDKEKSGKSGEDEKEDMGWRRKGSEQRENEEKRKNSTNPLHNVWSRMYYTRRLM